MRTSVWRTPITVAKVLKDNDNICTILKQCVWVWCTHLHVPGTEVVQEVVRDQVNLFLAEQACVGQVHQRGYNSFTRSQWYSKLDPWNVLHRSIQPTPLIRTTYPFPCLMIISVFKKSHTHTLWLHAWFTNKYRGCKWLAIGVDPWERERHSQRKRGSASSSGHLVSALLSWSSVCKAVLLVQPNSFNDQQRRSLEDYIVLRYNSNS